ncbi:hypothetical protein niasHT_027146 [Heterodera trifolii]|uniref:Integrase catalytic domain-containing protein n=1 Tax=Heterodera trifolii TaxID=157864 RepID=A0ABD2JVD7_9BILA
MQHTKRYLLVPEEIYQSLASPPPSDGTSIGLELKRLNKLTRDEDERPVGVKLENLSDVVDAMPKPVNVRRPIVVATRRHLKVGRARKENVEQLQEDDDDDHDHETPKTSSSNKRQPTQTEILKLIYKNAQSLGVSEEGQVLRAGGRPFITSSVYDIVSHLLNKDKRAQNKEPTAFKEFPTGVCEPVKTKTSVNMIGAFGRIFKRSKYIPWKVLTDQGKEFTARAVQQFFRAKDVEHFCMLTSPQFHAGMPNWIDVVQNIVSAINHSPNSSIGMCPADVNFKNAEELRQKLHNAAENVVRRQPKYSVGDRVRIEKYKHVFQKGYLPRFTNELFTVAEVHTERSPVVYRLRDDKNEISGTVEQQFVQIEWQTGNTVRIELSPSNVTNPLELSKNLYRLLGEGSDPLAKKVRSTQNSFMLTINKARRWAREEYIKRKTKEKRGVRDEELLLQAMLTDTGTLIDLNSVTHGLLACEKRAETSNVPLRIPVDDNDSYQKKIG